MLYVCFYIVKKIEHKERLDLIYEMCIVHKKCFGLAVAYNSIMSVAYTY